MSVVWETVVCWNIEIAEYVKLEGRLLDEGWLPCVQYPAARTEYFINVWKLESTCLLVDNTVQCIENSLEFHFWKNIWSYISNMCK